MLDQRDRTGRARRHVGRQVADVVADVLDGLPEILLRKGNHDTVARLCAHLCACHSPLLGALLAAVEAPIAHPTQAPTPAPRFRRSLALIIVDSLAGAHVPASRFVI